MDKIDAFIIDLPLWQQEIVECLRVFILQTVPGIKETYKYKVPYYEYKKHLCYINPKKNEVILGLVQGKILAETNPHLSGNQKQVRHIIIEKMTLELEEIIRYTLQEVVILNDELFKVNKQKWSS